MSGYRVVGANGRTSPPISERELYDYVRNGAIKPATLIIDDIANLTLPAAQHPKTAPLFGKAAAAGQQTARSGGASLALSDAPSTDTHRYQVLGDDGTASAPLDESAIYASIRKGNLLPTARLTDRRDGRIIEAQSVPVFAAAFRQAGYRVGDQPGPTGTAQKGTGPGFIIGAFTTLATLTGALGLAASFHAPEGTTNFFVALLVVASLGFFVAFLLRLPPHIPQPPPPPPPPPPRCHFCEALILRVSYPYTTDEGEEVEACPECHRNLQRKISRAATKDVKVTVRR